jgi:hypothetical protein
MHPDRPHQGGSSPDPVEQLLRTLPVPALPADWRSGILAAAVPPPVPPFFTKSLTTFLAAAWGLIAVLHYTTTPLEPLPAHNLPPPAFPRSLPEEGGFTEPWLAQIHHSETE